MSAVHQTALPRTGPAGGTSRAAGQPGRSRSTPPPRLRVVRAPAQARTRVPFVLTCMALLAGSLLGALLLNTSMAQGEYERFALQSRLAESTQVQQQITNELRLAESSAQLAAAASALGMVPTTHGAYLRLADGAVLGDPVPAGAGG